jgi:hypothetical protein
MARHTMVTSPMVMSTMYVSWKADMVAAQYDMDSVWKTNQISQQLNVTQTAPAIPNRYYTSPV